MKLKQDFDCEGYIFYPGFLSEQETEKLTENVSRYIKDVIPTMLADHDHSLCWWRYGRRFHPGNLLTGLLALYRIGQGPDVFDFDADRIARF